MMNVVSCRQATFLNPFMYRGYSTKFAPIIHNSDSHRNLNQLFENSASSKVSVSVYVNSTQITRNQWTLPSMYMQSTVIVINFILV